MLATTSRLSIPLFRGLLRTGHQFRVIEYIRSTRASHPCHPCHPCRTLRSIKYDEEYTEPHCEVDEKVAFIKKLAEYVGVDLTDVLPKDD